MVLVSRDDVPEFVAGCLVAAILVTLWFAWNVHPPHPDYAVDLTTTALPGPPLLAGVAVVDMTTSIPDAFDDTDGNGLYDSWNEVWHDGNGNRRFDARWMAGFEQNKPATGVLDPLTARAVILQRGDLSVGIVTLDLVGLLYPEVVRIRLEEPGAQGLDHVIVTSTHTHAAPDCLGYWSMGVDPQEQRDFVRRRAGEALALARTTMTEVDLKVASVPMADLVTDARVPPRVLVEEATALALVPRNGAPPTTLVVASCHPTLLGRGSSLLTPDWPADLRRALESRGGRALFLQGAAGGQALPVYPESHVPFDERRRSARVLGDELARRVTTALAPAAVERGAEVAFGLKARTVYPRIGSWKLYLAVGIGLFGRGTYPWWRARTEVGVLTLGSLRAVLMPGEPFPEEAVGGEINPPGADYTCPPQEVPPLLELAGGPHPVVVGLANDELGYLVPHSEWDETPPHLNGSATPPGQEGASLGPDAATELHRAVRELLAGR